MQIHVKNSCRQAASPRRRSIFTGFGEQIAVTCAVFDIELVRNVNQKLRIHLIYGEGKRDYGFHKKVYRCFLGRNETRGRNVEGFDGGEQLRFWSARYYI